MQLLYSTVALFFFSLVQRDTAQESPTLDFRPPRPQHISPYNRETGRQLFFFLSFFCFLKFRRERTVSFDVVRANASEFPISRADTTERRA